MPWPFARGEPAPPGERPAGAGGRQGEAKDPAAQLRAQTRRRLIGAAALLLVAVILLPMLLDGAPRPVADDVTITVAAPSAAPAALAVPAPADSPAAEETLAEATPAESAPVSAPRQPTKAGKDEKAAKGDMADKADSAAGRSTAALPSPKPAVPPPAAGRFALQVAAVSTPAAADELKAQLIKGGFIAYVESVATAEGTRYRVRVGPFASRDEAQRAAERLRAAGHKAALVGG